MCVWCAWNQNLLTYRYLPEYSAKSTVTFEPKEGAYFKNFFCNILLQFVITICKTDSWNSHRWVIYSYTGIHKAGLHTNFFSWWPKMINYQFLVARTGNLVARRKKKLEMNGGNIRLRLRMTLNINVGCLSLASEMNDGNIRLRMTLK